MFKKKVARTDHPSKVAGSNRRGRVDPTGEKVVTFPAYPCPCRSVVLSLRRLNGGRNAPRRGRRAIPMTS